jgi:hypothetical protein
VDLLLALEYPPARRGMKSGCSDPQFDAKLKEALALSNLKNSVS